MRLPFRLVLAALLLVTGCGRKSGKEYPLRGEVVGPGSEPRTLLIHHEEIPGYMPAMTMEFNIGDADASFFKEGKKVRGRMIDNGDGSFSLEGLEVINPVLDINLDGASRMLMKRAQETGRKGILPDGEPTPEFFLLDQTGSPLGPDRFKGHPVVLNFIYTRCPVANMCPLSTARMQALQLAARKEGPADLQLVTISMDPAYDTPAVLSTYARARGIDTTNFSFLTGPEEAVRLLLKNFGVIAIQEEKLWTHSVSTILIGRDGRILRRIPTNDWQPGELLPLLK